MNFLSVNKFLESVNDTGFLMFLLEKDALKKLGYDISHEEVLEAEKSVEEGKIEITTEQMSEELESIYERYVQYVKDGNIIDYHYDESKGRPQYSGFGWLKKITNR